MAFRLSFKAAKQIRANVKAATAPQIPAPKPNGVLVGSAANRAMQSSYKRGK